MGVDAGLRRRIEDVPVGAHAVADAVDGEPPAGPRPDHHAPGTRNEPGQCGPGSPGGESVRHGIRAAGTVPGVPDNKTPPGPSAPVAVRRPLLRRLRAPVGRAPGGS